MSAIDSVLVPGLLALSSVSRNGGTTVLKTGYHGPRDWLRRNHPNDYSIQHAKDQKGPGDKGAGCDWVFDDARLRSDFSTISKYSKLLYEAGQKKDPRAYPLREFYGNIDSDRTVEGWSFYRDRPGSSDSSHLWHIHFSVWRQYINDATAMRSILSILQGDDDDMPSLEEIADKLARDTEFLNGVADALLARDGVPNLLPHDDDNDNIMVKNALAEVRRDSRQTRATVEAIFQKLEEQQPLP